MADGAADDDVDALHRDPAAGRGVAAHDEEAAAPRRARRLARAALDDDRPRHHVLGDAGARVPVHAHGRELVHAGAVVADVPVDLDLDVRVDPARDRVGAVRVDDAPPAWARAAAGELVQPCVQLAERRRGQVDDLDAGSLRRLHRHQASAFSQA